MIANGNKLDTVKDKMDAYVGWVKKLHDQPSPDANGIDIREEVKFTLPDQGVYTGGWCRPQNDGAPLRAITLMNYCKILEKDACDALKPVISKDLD